MNPKQLRALLLDLLSEEIGKYSNGIPSIWVYGSGSNPPSKSDGLEVLIKNAPGGNPENMSGGVRYHAQMWELTLKNWRMDSNLAIAIRKIQANLNTRRYMHYPANEELLERARIYIFDPVVLPPRDMIQVQEIEITDSTQWTY